MQDGSLPDDEASSERIIRQAKRYTLVEGDLYRCSSNRLMLKCISREEGRNILADIHEGECGSHSASRTLVGKAFRHGFYWPTTLEVAAEMVKHSKAC